MVASSSIRACFLVVPPASLLASRERNLLYPGGCAKGEGGGGKKGLGCCNSLPLPSSLYLLHIVSNGKGNWNDYCTTTRHIPPLLSKFEAGGRAGGRKKELNANKKRGWDKKWRLPSRSSPSPIRFGTQIPCHSAASPIYPLSRFLATVARFLRYIPAE